MIKEELVEYAIRAREKSYSPYSNFKVGAALLTSDDSVFEGANIENASYPLSMCAERVAMFNAYMSGVENDDIVALAVVADTDTPVAPCGACRQVMAELLPRNTIIYLANLKGEIKECSIDELLPYSFSGDDLWLKVALSQLLENQM